MTVPLAWSPSRRPREEITDGDLSVRRWRRDDVDILHHLILGNIEHLRPWMAWISSEPATRDARAELLDRWERAWDSGEDFAVAVFTGSTAVGSAGLHLRQGRGILDIGYWIDASHTGRGLATLVAGLLADEALSISDVHAVEIHHDVYNVASGRVAEKAGFAAVADYESVPEAPGCSGVSRRWVRFRP